MNLQKSYIEISSNPLLKKDDMEKLLIADRLTVTDFNHKVKLFNKQLQILLTDKEKENHILRCNFFAGNSEETSWSNKAKYDFVLDIESTSVDRFIASYLKQLKAFETQYFSWVEHNCYKLNRIGFGQLTAGELANTILVLNSESKDSEFLDNLEVYVESKAYDKFFPTCRDFNTRPLSSGKGIYFNEIPVYSSDCMQSGSVYFKFKDQKCIEFVDVIGINPETNMIACRVGVKYKIAKTQVMSFKVY